MKNKPALERAARALCSIAGNPENTKFEGRPMWMSYLPEARAVIEAIREPTQSMTGYGGDAVRGIRPTSTEHASAVWQAMIDAALDDDSGG